MASMGLNLLSRYVEGDSDSEVGLGCDWMDETVPGSRSTTFRRPRPAGWPSLRVFCRYAKGVGLPVHV